MPTFWILVRPYSSRWSTFDSAVLSRQILAQASRTRFVLSVCLLRLVYSVADAQSGTAKQAFVGPSFAVGGFPVLPF